MTEPVDVNGETVIPQGAHVEGLVVDAGRSGHLTGRAHLRLVLDAIQVQGKTYDLRATAALRTGGNHKKRNPGWIAGGGGALIGVAAAGSEGALIGGPVGAGAGTAVAYFTGKRNIHLRAETTLTFRLEQPVTIDVNKS